MKLYFSPMACSLSPHIALREAGLDVELVRVDLKSHTLATDGSDFAGINPKGYVPVLELDDGSRLTEGPAIVQYIADLKPEAGLAPQNGTLPRYRLQEWLTFINSEIHKGFGPLFRPTTPEDVKAAARETLVKRLDYVAAQLKDHDYLLGDRFSVADGYLFTVLNWGQWTGVDVARWPALQSFQQRVASRSSVQAALAAEAA
ncbi:glutathione transferase GstA [Propionivibrio dicarboxylicus]|uniref:Glutathione S-transferase n=1 Tax=Propionivibrio dicarboxylicus TaxID=83767 RepID=A0A1G7V6A9_9RHOO|nr:glutathione transferase GstA [Propionivibrio dicarboxylicus]SDG55257.1 glutathione S-transferase [Propionivibrio dicarboxylicus]